MVTTSERRAFSTRVSPGILAAVYALYFATGATALAFEILWTRQFITVFGNSTYAMSVVLAAFMGGLGIGGLLFGKIIDRRGDPLWFFALIEGGVVIWALLIPSLLGWLGQTAPKMLAPISSLAVESVIRFGLSFAVLLVPCVLMGGTLPILTRFVAQSREKVGTRLSVLYGLNTLGSAVGCFATGFYFIETFGQSGTNMIAVSTNLAVLVVVLALRMVTGTPREAEAAPDSAASSGDGGAAGAEEISDAGRRLVLTAAFVSGFATMAVEVLWVRYLVFAVPNSQYSFTSILGVLLVGLALGSFLYNALLARRGRQLLWLAGTQLILGPLILVMLAVSSRAAMGRGPDGFTAGGPLAGGFFAAKFGAVWLAALTVFLPSVIIGTVFPLVAAAYTRAVSSVGRSVGKVSAVNTLGCIAGSLAPIVFLVAWLGIERGIYAIATLDFALGIVVLLAAAPRRWGLAAAVIALGFFAGAWRSVPANLTQEVFFSDAKHRGRHHETLFYREGPTATVMVVKDVVSGFKEVYIGGIEEVPTVYSGHVFFKLFGTLGPALHGDPSEVLVLCLGGGIAAGTIIEHPDVKRVECVDLVEDMVNACRQLSDVNNGLVADPKFSVVIDDARNYLVKSRKKFPVIICDSTHPKSPDSWPLYTKEFYDSVKGALADDGIFLQWAPLHGMSIKEYQIIVKTFQSTFPHTSVWYVSGYDEIGTRWATTMMLATPEKLSIDLDLLKKRLAPEAVKEDLAYWNLDTPEGVLSSFLCGEDAVREWTRDAPVNTDDLPFTQYITRFTGATEYGWPELASKLESVWPYVKPGGDPGERAALEASIERGRAARKGLLEQNIAEALKASPNDGALLRMKDNLRRGKDYLKRITEMYSDDEKMLVSAAQRMRSVCQYEGKGPVESYDQIAAIYEQALEVNPGNVTALTDLGGLAAAAGREAEAREYLDKALELDPNNVEALVEAGDVLTATEEYSRAISYLNRAVALAPDRLDIHNSLAAALTAVGSVDEAIVHLNRAIELSGDSQPEFHYNLGHAYDAKGDLENAAVSFRAALLANPSSVKYRLWLAMTLLDKGDTVAAKAEFEKVLAVEPENVDARARLGVILLGEDRLDDAIAEFRRALAASPGDPLARESMAKALVKKRAFAEAAAVLREGMKLQPTNEIARALAWLLATCPAAEVRNGREAIGLAESLDRITNYSSPEAMDTLGAAYAESAFYMTAAKAAERALSRATALGNADLAGAIQKRLDLYRAGRAYHEE